MKHTAKKGEDCAMKSKKALRLRVTRNPGKRGFTTVYIHPATHTRVKVAAALHGLLPSHLATYLLEAGLDALDKTGKVPVRELK